MPFTAVHVFGDSLVDAGNALKLAEWYGDLTSTDLPDGAPTADQGYHQGRFTNGFTFADLIANKYVGVVSKPVFPYGYEDPWLDLLISPFASKPTGPALNWAYGGAQIVRGDEAVPPLDGQTDAFRRYSGGNADQQALYLITIGGNDVRNLVPSSGDPATQAEATLALLDAADEFHQEVSQLIGMGVRNIVITGTPDVGSIPRYDYDGDGEIDYQRTDRDGDGVAETMSEAERRDIATAYSRELDGYIRQQIVLLEQAYGHLGVTITYVPFMDYQGPDGPVTGVTNSNLDLLAQMAGAPVDRDSIFFDQIHPNAQAHALVAASMLDAINGSAAGNVLALTAAEREHSAAGSIGVAGEVDRITVSLVAGTYYSFDMLGISSLPLSTDPFAVASVLADPLIRIIGPNGALRASNDDGGMGLDASVRGFYADVTGTYTIELRGVGALTGTYSAQASVDSGAAMNGGNVYTVSSAATVILESAQGLGHDVVKASVSYSLGAGAHIEELRTTNDRGKTAINLTGNDFGQKIVGNLSGNVLDGRGGNDTLAAGAGYDTLIGGAGSDTFLFASKLDGTPDTIKDFEVGVDRVELSRTIFNLAAGELGGAFATGTRATQADDRIIYDPATGKLYYDSDGTGSAQQVHFATLSPNLTLSSADFWVG